MKIKLKQFYFPILWVFVFLTVFSTKTPAPPVPSNPVPALTPAEATALFGFPVYNNPSVPDSQLIDHFAGLRRVFDVDNESAAQIEIATRAFEDTIREMRSRPLTAGEREALSFAKQSTFFTEILVSFSQGANGGSRSQMVFGLQGWSDYTPNSRSWQSGRTFAETIAHEIGHRIQMDQDFQTGRLNPHYLNPKEKVNGWTYDNARLRGAATEFHANMVQTGFNFEPAYTITSESYQTIQEYLSQYVPYETLKPLRDISPRQVFDLLKRLNQVRDQPITPQIVTAEVARAVSSTRNPNEKTLAQLPDHDLRIPTPGTQLTASELSKIEAIVRKPMQQLLTDIGGTKNSEYLKKEYLIEYYLDNLKRNGAQGGELELLRFMASQDSIALRFNSGWHFDFEAYPHEGKLWMSIDPFRVQGERAGRLRSLLLAAASQVRDLVEARPEIVKKSANADSSKFDPLSFLNEVRGFTAGFDGNVDAAFNRARLRFQRNLGTTSLLEAMGFTNDTLLAAIGGDDYFNSLRTDQKMAFLEMLAAHGDKLLKSNFSDLRSSERAQVLEAVSRDVQAFRANPNRPAESLRNLHINEPGSESLPDGVVSRPGEWVDNPAPPRNTGGQPTERIRYAVVPNPNIAPDAPGGAAVRQAYHLLTGEGFVPGVNVMVRRLAPGVNDPIRAVPGAGEAAVWIEADVLRSSLIPISGVPDGYQVPFDEIVRGTRRAMLAPNVADPMTSAEATMAVQEGFASEGHPPARGSEGERYFNELDAITDRVQWGTPDPATGARPCLNCANLSGEVAGIMREHIDTSAASTTSSGATSPYESITVGSDGSVSVYNQHFQFQNPPAVSTQIVQNLTTNPNADTVQITYAEGQAPSPVQSLVNNSTGSSSSQTVVGMGGDPLGTGAWGLGATAGLAATYDSLPGTSVPAGFSLGNSDSYIATGINPSSYGFNGRAGGVDVYYNRLPGNGLSNSGFPMASEIMPETPSRFGAAMARLRGSAGTVAFVGQIGLEAIPAAMMAYQDRRLNGNGNPWGAATMAFAEATISPEGMIGMGSMVGAAWGLQKYVGSRFNPALGTSVSGAFNVAGAGIMTLGAIQQYGDLYSRDAETYDIGNAAIYNDPEFYPSDLGIPYDRLVALLSMAVGQVGQDMANAQQGIFDPTNGVVYNSAVGTASDLVKYFGYLNPATWLPDVQPYMQTDPVTQLMNSYAAVNKMPNFSFVGDVGISWQESPPSSGWTQGTRPANAVNPMMVVDPNAYPAASPLKNFQILSFELLAANDPQFLAQLSAADLAIRSADPKQSLEEVTALQKNINPRDIAVPLTEAEYATALGIYGSLDGFVGALMQGGVVPYGMGDDTTQREGMPVITQGLQEKTVKVGESPTLTITATGEGLTYKWLRAGTQIAGTSSTLTLTNIQSNQAGIYTVVVTNAKGSVSSSAEMKVLTPPRITTQPVAQNKKAGESVTFTVAATGESLTYQWKKNGTVIAGATSASYTISNVQMETQAVYTVDVKNDGGTTTSSGARFRIFPTIITQPLSQAIKATMPVSLSVIAVGDNLTYQWYFNGVMMTANGIPITSWKIDNPRFFRQNAGSYTVTVTNDLGTVTSAAAILSLAP